MTEQEIIHLALENLQKQTDIIGRWEQSGIKGLDGQVILTLDNKEFIYNVEIKDELRSAHLEKIDAFSKQYPPFILVTSRLFPKIKEELRYHNIAYLEANGNMFLKSNGNILFIDVNQPIPTEVTSGRAFTKTGLKVVFQFLLDEAWINKPYREIAEQTGTGIGNITNIVNSLKQDGFLLQIIRNEYKLINKKALLDKWVKAYDQRLKPTLKIGTFRFLKDEDFNNWKKLPLQTGKTWWGGEPAGDLFTNYLRPAELALYTIEARTELIKNYRLIPDEKGNVNVYQKFWQWNEVNTNVVPPLLAYADLINQNDRRCTETAQKIYDEFLQDKL